LNLGFNVKDLLTLARVVICKQKPDLAFCKDQPVGPAWVRLPPKANPDNVPVRLEAQSGGAEGSISECQINRGAISGHVFNQSSRGVLFGDATASYTFEEPPEIMVPGEFSPPLEIHVEVKGKIKSTPCPSFTGNFLRNRSALASSRIAINGCIAINQGPAQFDATPKILAPGAAGTFNVASRLLVGGSAGQLNCLIEWPYELVPGN